VKRKLTKGRAGRYSIFRLLRGRTKERGKKRERAPLSFGSEKREKKEKSCSNMPTKETSPHSQKEKKKKALTFIEERKKKGELLANGTTPNWDED